jgi:hypothetical protein
LPCRILCRFFPARPPVWGIDPATEKIVGDPEAARRAIPEYRSPWKFPEQYLT